MRCLPATHIQPVRLPVPSRSAGPSRRRRAVWDRRASGATGPVRRGHGGASPLDPYTGRMLGATRFLAGYPGGAGGPRARRPWARPADLPTPSSSDWVRGRRRRGVRGRRPVARIDGARHPGPSPARRRRAPAAGHPHRAGAAGRRASPHPAASLPPKNVRWIRGAARRGTVARRGTAAQRRNKVWHWDAGRVQAGGPIGARPDVGRRARLSICLTRWAPIGGPAGRKHTVSAYRPRARTRKRQEGGARSGAFTRTGTVPGGGARGVGSKPFRGPVGLEAACQADRPGASVRGASAVRQASKRRGRRPDPERPSPERRVAARPSSARRRSDLAGGQTRGVGSRRARRPPGFRAARPAGAPRRRGRRKGGPPAPPRRGGGADPVKRLRRSGAGRPDRRRRPRAAAPSRAAAPAPRRRLRRSGCRRRARGSRRRCRT